MRRTHQRVAGWGPYLSQFHAIHPGITEEILSQASSTSGNPYQWLIETVPPDASILDVACGSAPTCGDAQPKVWVGIDRSREELQRARSKDNCRVVIGDASRLPFPDRSFDTVVCAMAMMLLDPLEQCITEMTRVLAPDGEIDVLLPGGPGALHISDFRRWARLLAALRVLRFRYPNDGSMRRLAATVQRHHLEVVTDERRRFSFHVTNTELADKFIDSLYLPNAHPRRVVAARRIARTWTGDDIGIPLRLVRLQPIPPSGDE